MTLAEDERLRQDIHQFVSQLCGMQLKINPYKVTGHVVDLTFYYAYETNFLILETFAATSIVLGQTSPILKKQTERCDHIEYLPCFYVTPLVANTILAQDLGGSLKRWGTLVLLIYNYVKRLFTMCVVSHFKFPIFRQYCKCRGYECTHNQNLSGTQNNQQQIWQISCFTYKSCQSSLV